MNDKYLEMYELYKQGMNLEQIGERYGLTKSAVHIGFKRRGLSTRVRKVTRDKPSNVEEFNDEDLVQAKEQWDKLDSKMKGTITEGYVANRLAEAGFDVWKPFMDNHKADMGVLKDGRLIRIQVKSATYDIPTKRFRTILKTRNAHGKHVEYEDGTIDVFIVFCPGIMAFYVIPAEVAKDNTAVNVLPHRERFKKAVAYVWGEYRDAFHLIQ